MMLPFLVPYTFEWDELKNLANVYKHGVSFEEAQFAFTDPRRCIILDETHTTELEQRYYCIGKIHAKICTVRFTLRKSSIRIIGAGYWRAQKKEYENLNIKTKN